MSKAKERKPLYFEFERAPRRGSTHIVAEGSPQVTLCGTAVDTGVETRWQNVAAAMPVKGGLLMQLDRNKPAARLPVTSWATCKKCIKAYPAAAGV